MSEQLLISDVVKMGERMLAEAGIVAPRVEAEILYCRLKHVDRSHFFMIWGQASDDRTMELFFDMIDQRRKRVPMQYLTGEQYFMGLKFKTARNVLIPRYDTEVVVAKAIEIARRENSESILDLCCGSGIIGIAIANELPNVKVTSTDFNPDAIALTQENASALGVKIEIKEGDLFEPVANKKFSMIVSNPPYVQTDVIPTLMPEVRDYEPRSALDGGADGLDFYRRIAAQSPQHLKSGGYLVLEIGHDQRDAVTQLLDETGAFDEISGLKDLAGHDRVISARVK